MKKLLMVLSLMISIMLSSSTLNAQGVPMAFNIQGGYSWLNGVLGAEAQFGRVGISGGWMPCKMPISEEKLSSYSGAVTYYTRPAGDEGYSYYASVGVASSGYRYETVSTWGYDIEGVLPMTIVMAGYKYDAGGVNCKLGGGYGWCEMGGTWTFELTLGFTLFGN